MNDAVAYNGSSYIAIQAGQHRNPIPAPSFWTLLARSEAGGRREPRERRARDHRAYGGTGPAGPQGTTGATGATGAVGMNWQGTWIGVTAYAVNDAVAYNGSSYIAIQAGSNQEPDTSSSFWTLLAQVGASGCDTGLHGNRRRGRRHWSHRISGTPGNDRRDGRQRVRRD